MIPGIALMIGAYISLRCFELFARPDSHFRSYGNRIAILFVAVITLLVTAWQTAEIWTQALTSRGVPGLP